YFPSQIDYATSIDLHADQDYLHKHALLVTSGHDEYWSKEMRDNVEAFVSSGGNVCFLSANNCWWQVRFEADQLGRPNRIMVCYKDDAYKSASDGKSHDDLTDRSNSNNPKKLDDSFTTGRWFEPPINRPENSLTGESFRY